MITSERARQIYSPALRQRMLETVQEAYEATERHTLLPAKRDAIERAIGQARANEMPEEQFAVALGAFEREIQEARDQWDDPPAPFAADIFA